VQFNNPVATRCIAVNDGTVKNEKEWRWRWMQSVFLTDARKECWNPRTPWSLLVLLQIVCAGWISHYRSLQHKSDVYLLQSTCTSVVQILSCLLKKLSLVGKLFVWQTYQALKI
jgi:hypothetical protein